MATGQQHSAPLAGFKIKYRRLPGYGNRYRMCEWQQGTYQKCSGTGNWVIRGDIVMIGRTERVIRIEM